MSTMLRPRTGHVSEIEALAVDEEIVDPSPTGLLEPRDLGRVFRIGDVEDQQAEVALVHLYADYRQIARDLDVQRRSGGGDLGCLAHGGRVGDVDDVDEAAKVPHQRAVPREIEVGPVGELPFPGEGDKDDLADAFHVEAVGGILGGEDGERSLLSGGGGGNEEDQQRYGLPLHGRRELSGVHGWSSWIRGRPRPTSPGTLLYTGRPRSPRRFLYTEEPPRKLRGLSV